MSTRSSDHWHTPHFSSLKTGIHQIGVGQRPDVKKVGINLVERFVQAGNTKRGPPKLSLPSPVREHAQQPGSTPSQDLVADWKAAHRHAIDGNLLDGECLASG